MSDLHWYYLNSVTWGMLSHSLGASAQHAEPTNHLLPAWPARGTFVADTTATGALLLKVATEIYYEVPRKC